MGEPDTGAEKPDQTPLQDRRSGRSAAAARMQHQASWVDQQIRVAMAKGEFDELSGAGKPIKDLGTEHDPDWWLKKLIEREQITGVLPPSVQLRKEDAELDRRLDELSAESEVRREVEDFNERVIRARYSLAEGPPLVTMPRDVGETVAAWKERRAERRARLAAQPRPESPKRRWWRPRRPAR
jgi:hypothetical protein